MFFLTGCRTEKDPSADDTGDTSPLALDGDGDGYASDVDCDDDNAFVNPGRQELCSTDFDDDCDGQINEADAADALDWSSYGTLEVNGTASKGVLFTCSSSSPSAGDWYGLILGSRSETALLEYLDIEYGGYSSSYPGALYISGGEPELSSVGVYESGTNGLYVTGSSTAPYVHDSTFQDNVESGVYVYSSSGLDTSTTPGFTDNTLTGNGEYPMVVPAAFAG